MCSKKWDNIKQDARKRVFELKREQRKTGGGPPPKPLPPMTEKVISIIGASNVTLSGIEGGIDSIMNVSEQEVPKVSSCLELDLISDDCTVPTSMPVTTPSSAGHFILPSEEYNVILPMVIPEGAADAVTPSEQSEIAAEQSSVAAKSTLHELNEGNLKKGQKEMIHKPTRKRKAVDCTLEQCDVLAKQNNILERQGELFDLQMKVAEQTLEVLQLNKANGTLLNSFLKKLNAQTTLPEPDSNEMLLLLQNVATDSLQAV